MTTRNKTDLKTYFETGDIPTQQNFYDLIESMLNRIDDAHVVLPPLAGNAGKVLTTNGISTSWSTSVGGGGGITEAPSNGNQYVRKDAAWSTISNLPWSALDHTNDVYDWNKINLTNAVYDWAKIDKTNADYLKFGSSGVVGAVPSFTVVGLELTIGECTVSIFNNPLFEGISTSYIIAGSTLTCVDNVMNYVYVDYNGGNPIYQVTQDRLLINESNTIPINTVLASSGYLHLSHWDSVGSGLSNKLHHRLVNTQRHVRESGLALSVTAGVVTIGEGIVWRGARDFNLPVTISDGSNNTQWFAYTCVNNVWSSTFMPTPAYNYTKYNNRTTGLVSLGANKYTINWIFRGVEDHNHGYVILGDKEYKDLATATAESVIPPLPPLAPLHTILVGRIICKVNVVTPAAVESAFDAQFVGTVINDHNSLSGLNGGTFGEYYHLTQLDYTDKILNRKWGSGVDYSQFDVDGTLRMYGAATVWQDLLPTAVYTPTGAASPNITVYAGATTLQCQEFTNTGGAEEFNPSYQMPHQWVEGSIIKPHLHLAVPDDGNGGTITMRMTYQWVNVNGTGIVNETTISGSIVRLANAGVGHNMILSFGDIDGTGKLISSILTARIYRDTNDSFQSSVWLKSADIHVECNSIGSGTALVK